MEIKIVAEIGITHEGSLEKALRMIDMAHDCGVQYVKFQKRDLDIAIPLHMRTQQKETPFGLMSYMDYKQMLEFGVDEYNKIASYCVEKGMSWFVSIWDKKSLAFIREYDTPFLKTPSAVLTNLDLMEAIAQEGKKTYIATGMSEMSDVENDVDIFRGLDSPFCLVHATGLYPAPNETLNLNCITTLQEQFDCEVGYSCHSVSILPSIIAVMNGATYIEKHITLDRTGWIADNAASLEQRGLELLVRDINAIPNMLGSTKKQFYQGEKEKLKTMKYWVC